MSSTVSTAIGSITDQVRAALPSEPTDEAIQAVEELVPEGDEFRPYVRRFLMLIALSAGIAAFGLLADSAAVVIGAMLVAPLMTPITAAAAATVMARNRRLLRSLWVIAVGTAGAIAVGYVTARFAGTEVANAGDLPAEVLARTFPGLLDLGIAITAGAAAGYILPRRSTMGALPGVGIAVALVPPLVVVGITIAAGARDLAANAFLLYITNLAAIIFTASVMLILAGFHPDVEGAGSLRRRLVITMAAVVAVAIPLTLHTQAAVADASLRRSVSRSVQEWDGTVRIIDMTSDVYDNRANVELLVSGPNEPQPVWRLAERIQDRFDGPVDLRLQYQRDDLFEVSVR